MTAPDVNADVRARFEAWARQTRLYNMSRNESDSRRYHDPITQGSWEGYRAAHADLSGDVRELVEGYRSLYRAYVNTLEVARDRIRELGGECDPVDVMERGDPALSLARERLAKFTHQEKP